MPTIQQKRILFNDSAVVPTFSLGMFNGILTQTRGSAPTTDTRASADTRYNALGVLEAIGNNVPADEWDALTLAPLGRRFQSQKTNNTLYTDNFAASNWSKNGGSILSGKFVPTAANSTHNIFQNNYAAVAGSVYTIYAEFDAGEYNCIQLSGSSAAFGGSAYITFGLTGAGVIGSLGAGASNYGIKKLYNGRFALWATFVAAISSSGGLGFFVVADVNSARGASFLGDGVSGVTPRIIQIEEGGRSSYMPTAAAPILRQADSVIYPTDGWFNPVEGTFIVSCVPYIGSLNVGTDRGLIQVGDSINTSLQLRLAQASNNNIMGLIGTGASYQLTQPGACASGVRERLAFGYSAAAQGYLGRNNGGGPAFATIPGIWSGAAQTTLRLASGANAWIDNVVYYPRFLPQAKSSLLIA